MAWVCQCGQKNLVSGLPCLACDRIPSTDTPPVSKPTDADGAGGRFRDELPDGLVASSRFRDEPEAPAGDVTFDPAAVEIGERSWPEFDRRHDVDRRSGDRRRGVPSDISELTAFDIAPAEPDYPHDARDSDLFADWDELSSLTVGGEDSATGTDETASDDWWDTDTSAGTSRGGSDDFYDLPGADYDPDATAAYSSDELDFDDPSDDRDQARYDDFYRADSIEDDRFDYDDIDHDRQRNYAPVRGDRSYFVDDVDLDEPDQYEDDEWAGDPDDYDEYESREPRRDRRPTPRNRANRGPRGGAANGDIGEFIRMHGKILIVFAILAVILLLSTIGSKTFSRTASADPERGDSVTCAAAPGNTEAAGLQRYIVEPDGWTAVTDAAGGTGNIDFTRALELEPDADRALSILDRTRFSGGYDRSFTKATKALDVSMYRFADDICAADYLDTRSAPASSRAVAVPAGRAWLDGQQTFFIGRKADVSVMISSDGFTSSTTDDFVEIAMSQLDAVGA